MKPYGMTLVEVFKAHDDKLGALQTAPNTNTQGRLKSNTYRSLRKRKKNSIRRRQKRRERNKAKVECRVKEIPLE